MGPIPRGALVSLGGLLLALAAAFAPRPAAALAIERVVSPLGIEAWLVRNEAVPVIAMQFAFRGGVELDPPGREGLANLAASLLDEGAGDLDSEAFRRRLEDAAIGLGFDAGTDAFFGGLTSVSAKSEEAFDLLGLALTRPRFDGEAVERMRAAIMAQVRRRVADPAWIARRVFFERAFPGHPYGRPSQGTLATIGAITAADLRAFARSRLARDNLVIGVSGDISAQALGPILDRIFGPLPATAAAAVVPDAVPATAGERILVLRPGAQSTIVLAQPGIGRDDPDFYAAQVMVQILGGGGPTSRLTQELREERGFSYGIDAALSIYDHSTLLSVATDVSNANVAETLDIILAAWRGMAEEGVTGEEVEAARSYLTGSLPLALTTTADVASFLMALQLDDRPIDYLDRLRERIGAVTQQDVNRIAARLLAPEALSVVVVGSPGGDIGATETLDASRIVNRELGGGSG